MTDVIPEVDGSPEGRSATIRRFSSFVGVANNLFKDQRLRHGYEKNVLFPTSPGGSPISSSDRKERYDFYVKSCTEQRSVGTICTAAFEQLETDRTSSRSSQDGVAHYRSCRFRPR